LSLFLASPDSFLLGLLAEFPPSPFFVLFMSLCQADLRKPSFFWDSLGALNGGLFRAAYDG
jgi:hypothetical protein